MARPYLRSLEREFDLADVTVAGRPSIRHGRLASGPTARYAPATFDRPRCAERAAETTPEPAPETTSEPTGQPAPSLTPADLEAAVAEARAEAVSATASRVRAELEASLKAREVLALEALGRQLDERQAAYLGALAELRDEAREVILEVARAVAPGAFARAPLANVERLLEELVPSLDAQPRLELKLAPGLAAAGREGLARIAAASGFQGEIVVEPDPSMAPGDARLSWQGGAAERSTQTLTEEALRIARGWLGAHAEMGAPDTRSNAGEILS
jgi:flagellar assembly protein FliH